MIATPHHARLLQAGVPEDALDGLELREASDQLPGWFAELGNALYLGEGLAIPPRVEGRLAVYPYSNSLIVLASPLENLSSLLIGGDDATIFIGGQCELTA